MIIEQVNKYTSIIENCNIILVFYKKKINCIINKNKGIVYIESVKWSNIEYINGLEFNYKVIEVENISEIYNQIKL